MFDIKLIDGRYFSNVCIVDEFTGDMDNMKDILDNSNYKMSIYHFIDDEEEELLATIHSDDIEYICEAYEYKEENN